MSSYDVTKAQWVNEKTRQKKKKKRLGVDGHSPYILNKNIPIPVLTSEQHALNTSQLCLDIVWKYIVKCCSQMLIKLFIYTYS